MRRDKTTYLIIFSVTLFSFACQNSIENQPTRVTTENVATTPHLASKETKTSIDVPKFTNKSAVEIDKILAQPEKVTPAIIAREIPGEYRLYKLAENPKGLSIRFYKDKAVRFNLLLGKPEKSSREALLKYFNIDVAKMTSVKGESLSETWKGSANGVNFSTAYAKRDKPGGDFVMIHAETNQ